MRKIMIILALLLIAAPVAAQYPNSGTVNPDTYTFTAAVTGTLTIYFVGSTAGDTSQIGLLVNGTNINTYGLTNKTSTHGDSMSWPVVTGDILVFILHNLTRSADFYSDETLNADGQHVYSEPFISDGIIPNGTYIGFEDRTLASSDKSYNDMVIAFVVTPTAPEPPPAPVEDTTTFAWDYTDEQQVSLEPDGGFRLHVGSTSGVYNESSVIIPGPATREATINNETLCGDKFFAVTARDSDGNESGYSNEVTQAYPPEPATALTFNQPTNAWSWALSLSEPNCIELGYHLYLSQQQGVYGPANIVTTAGKGTGAITYNIAGYQGTWYAVVAPYTVGADGREILGPISNEINFTAVFAVPSNLRIVTQ